MMNDILHALDRGDVTVVILLDLSAAFDTTDHNILSQRLEHLYGISGTPLNWFRSYLSNRTQTVTIHNKLSQPTLLNFGVPQGSVLGPIQLILCTKPLVTLIRQHSISTESFADSATLTFFATNTCLSRENTSCRDKSMLVLSRQIYFVSTNIILSRQRFCRGKHAFVAKKDLFCCEKHVFVATRMILVAAPANDSCRQNNRWCTDDSPLQTVIKLTFVANFGFIRYIAGGF